MAWSGIKVEGETINDGGRKLKIGTFPYRITGAGMAVVKKDVTGKTQQVIIDLLHGDSYACRVYFAVMAENDQQREIAEKGLRAFAQAAGLKGLVKPETLKKLVDGYVLVSAVETPNKTGGAPYINISTVEAYDPEDADEEEVEEEEEEEEAPPAKPAKLAKPVKTSKKPEPEPDEDEDEEEDEEEVEEEAPAPAAKKKRPW